MLVGAQDGTCRIFNPTCDYRLVVTHSTYQAAQEGLLEDEAASSLGTLWTDSPSPRTFELPPHEAHLRSHPGLPQPGLKLASSAPHPVPSVVQDCSWGLDRPFHDTVLVV